MLYPTLDLEVNVERVRELLPIRALIGHLCTDSKAESRVEMINARYDSHKLNEPTPEC